MIHKNYSNNHKLEYLHLEHKIKLHNLEIDFQKFIRWTLQNLQKKHKKLKEKDNLFFGVKQKYNNQINKVHQRY